jgi:UTP--glucose-1-phosphate uridylyltransferase
MASKLSALPSHLKPSAGGAQNNGDAAEFARKHHGKTQSHVVSEQF